MEKGADCSTPFSLPLLQVEGLDQDDFWVNQPKVTNLIASKVIGQLYGSSEPMLP